MSFFVATGHIAKSGFEQIVTSQRQEPGCQVSLVPQVDMSNCRSQIVISELFRNSTELLKEPYVRIQETDHVVSQISSHKGSFTVSTACAVDHDFGSLSRQNDGRFAPVDLNLFAKRVIDRAKDLGRLILELANQITDGPSRTNELVLIAEPLKNPYLCVTLFSGPGPILLEPGFHYRNYGVSNRTDLRHLEDVIGRLGID